jgi:hypothetical protein
VKADAMMIYIPPMVEGINEVATFVNEKSDETNANAITTVNAKNSAVASANFKGKWSSKTGQSNIPAAWEHNGILWNQNVNLANIQSSEPSFSNSDYTAIASYSTIQVENRLKGNQNWNIPGRTGHPLPDATPRDYPVGAEIALGIFAYNTPIVGMTLINGVISAESGGYTRLSKGLFATDFAGIKTSDGVVIKAGGLSSGVNGIGFYPSDTVDGFSNVNVLFSVIETKLGIPRGAHKFVGCSELPGVWPDVSDEESANAVLFNKEYASVPIGAEVAFDTPPPTNDPRFRFVKLTADDAYNGSLLNNKAVSGSFPNVVTKMRINTSLSPIDGQDIFMLNTMEAIPTPGLNSGVIIQDAIRNISGSYGRVLATAGGSVPSGPFTGVESNAMTFSGSDTKLYQGGFNASLVVPTASRNQPFGVTKVFYKRIY